MILLVPIEKELVLTCRYLDYPATASGLSDLGHQDLCLIAEHKFSKLTDIETNKLLKHIGKDHEVTEGMTLADIYNIDIELFKSTNKSKIVF